MPDNQQQQLDEHGFFYEPMMQDKKNKDAKFILNVLCILIVMCLLFATETMSKKIKSLQAQADNLHTENQTLQSENLVLTEQNQKYESELNSKEEQITDEDIEFFFQEAQDGLYKWLGGIE